MIRLLPWILITALYIPVFLDLYQSAWDVRDYTHAYFILPAALLMIWVKRRALTSILHKDKGSQSTNWAFLILLTSGLLLFIFGWRQDYLFVQTLSLLVAAVGLTGFLCTPRVVRTLAFPLLYLLLLIPPPVGMLDAITLPMRYGASMASAAVLALLHYPVAREGLLLTIGESPIYMGAPCSGFRSLITMLSLGLIYVYFNQGSRMKNLILVTAIIPLALVGNLIRIVSLCLVTFYFGEATGQGFFHHFSGLVVFIIMVLGLMILEKTLNRSPRPGQKMKKMNLGGL